MVQFWIVLGDIETPSWAVALGTPVLVFAAIGFGFRHVFKETVGRIRGKKEEIGDEEQGPREDVVGPRDEEVDEEKYNGDRSLSTAYVSPDDEVLDVLLILHRPTVVPTEAPSRESSVSSHRPPSIGNVSVGRHSTFWQRDLRDILNSVVSDRPRAHNRN